MLGLDDVLLEIMDKLSRGVLDRRIIPIVGMGGICKTNLATNVYAKQLIKEHFDICAWNHDDDEGDCKQNDDSDEDDDNEGACKQDDDDNKGYKSHVVYSSEADALEMRIADAAYAAEDAIESHIMDQIHGGQRIFIFFKKKKRISSVDFYQGLQRVLEDMDSLNKEVIEIKERMVVQHQLHRSSSISGGTLRSSSTGKNTTMVGFDDVLLEIMDKLTRGELDRHIIPIVGMGGIGKTTLARNLYAKPLIIEHFDICAWATISQEYDTREILSDILSQFKKEGRGGSTENELGEMLYKHLWGRRYLIVMDDMWSIEAWDKVKIFFPDNKNGSRIMITTRLSNLAFQLTRSYNFQMQFLDEDESWNLFCKIVFGKDDCSIELEEIGKKIVKNCQGLPLSIVVIGGLLKKYEGTREFWEYTLENITSSAINLEDDARCLQILYMSFKELPVHLKPCFLYMGIFQEDKKIRVSQLIKLWVAEGFLKPINGKSLEVVAEEYLMELIDRNLILVDKLGSNGNTKLCKIHDLLRDLCLREAQKQKFLCVIKLRNLSSTPSLNTERRIIIHGRTPEECDSPQVLNALQSASLARSLIVQYMSINFARALRSANLIFLRVFKVEKSGLFFRFTEYELYNLRYMSTEYLDTCLLQANFYWNLQTLQAVSSFEVMDSKIWMMPLLRHARLYFNSLPDPPNGQIVLENLQTLSNVSISECREKVVEMFPNLKTLEIYCRESDSESLHCFSNLGLLHKLEHLKCHFVPFYNAHSFTKTFQRELQQNIAFPHSLKKLTLSGNPLHWEDITTKIGPLPHLQVLKLEQNAAAGADWVTDEGKFRSLKFLLIHSCDDFVNWMTDNTHFPRLEHLRLRFVDKLKEIPWGIGEIPTLESIELFGCSSSAVMSAKRILEEQEELGNEGLRLVINSELVMEMVAVIVIEGTELDFMIRSSIILALLFLSTNYKLNLPACCLQLIVHCNSREVEEALRSANLRLLRFDLLSDDFVLGNLHSVSIVRLLECREKVVKRIPNIKKLKISCEELDRKSLYCFNNLYHLDKLEHLSCDFQMFPSCRVLQQNIAFPRSLKKLTLHGRRLHWEDIATKIGPLPLLQVLRLGHKSFIGSDWVTFEEQFCSLKFLLIDLCDDLVNWMSDDTHFLLLEHLHS
ncbi:hypothetical protein ACS0TY_035389 [Phlomoides rotata]